MSAQAFWDKTADLIAVTEKHPLSHEPATARVPYSFSLRLLSSLFRVSHLAHAWAKIKMLAPNPMGVVGAELYNPEFRQNQVPHSRLPTPAHDGVTMGAVTLLREGGSRFKID